MIKDTIPTSHHCYSQSNAIHITLNTNSDSSYGCICSCICCTASMNAPSPIRILWFVNGFNTLFLSFDSSSLLHESILRSYLYFLNSIYRVSLTYTSYHDSWDWDLICRIPYSFIYTKWNHIFKWVQNWHTSNRNIRSSYQSFPSV